MLYPVVIEPGDEGTAFGVIVPDLEGCFSAGDTLEVALANVREAIDLHLESLLDDGKPIPAPTRDLAALTNDPDFANHIFALVDVRLEDLDDTVERINMTIPRRVLKAIDIAAAKAGESRSSFVAQAALARARGAVEPGELKRMLDREREDLEAELAETIHQIREADGKYQVKKTFEAIFDRLTTRVVGGDN